MLDLPRRMKRRGRLERKRRRRARPPATAPGLRYLREAGSVLIVVRRRPNYVKHEPHLRHPSYHDARVERASFPPHDRYSDPSRYEDVLALRGTRSGWATRSAHGGGPDARCRDP